MRANNFVSQRQAETGPFRLCSKKGIKNFLSILRRNAHTFVPYVDLYFPMNSSIHGRKWSTTSCDLHPPAFGHRIERIRHEIEKHLCEQTTVPPERRESGFEHRFHAPFPIAQQGSKPLCHVIQQYGDRQLLSIDAR